MCFWQKLAKAKVAYQKNGEKLDSRHGKNQLLPQSNLKKLFPGSLVVFRSRVGQKPNESVSNQNMKKLVVSLHIPLKILPKKSVCLGSIFGPKASPPKKKTVGFRQQFDLTYGAASKSRGCLCLFTRLQVYIYWHIYFLGKWSEVSCTKNLQNKKQKKIHQQNWFQSNSPLFPAKLTPPETRLDLFKLRKHDKCSWSQPHGQRLWDTPVAAERKSPGWALHPAAWSNHHRRCDSEIQGLTN